MKNDLRKKEREYAVESYKLRGLSLKGNLPFDKGEEIRKLQDMAYFKGQIYKKMLEGTKNE